MASEKKNFITQFPRNFWTVITMEFFERGSYYGLASVLSIYLVTVLNFSKQSVGVINSVTRPMLYLTPILAGAIADRFGYRKTLFFAFSVMSFGYFLSGLTTSYELIFLSLLLMTLGAGSFKPIISGTIARTTTEQNSTLGFGIYYWSINLGAFIFPLILVPFLKEISWSYIFFMSAIGTGWLLLLNFFVYKEPAKPENGKSIGQVLKGAVLVLKDFRFILMIVIYSGFWILYFQMFDTVLWYLKDYMDMTPVNNVVNGFLGLFTAMTAHPKFISYVGLIAPEDKKALYLGYSFLYGVLGSGIGGILGANLYVHFIDKLHNPSALWITFSLIGVATMVGLLLFNKFLAKK